MPTRHPFHKMHKKEVFWEYHIECWSKTVLTQAHYCRENDLSQSDFSKWKKKLKPNAKQTKRKTPYESKNYYELYNSFLNNSFTNQCAFCARGPKTSNKLFYGINEFVAICDYCLWHKSKTLHQEIKGYKKLYANYCSVCNEEKPGLRIGNVHYQVCERCLINALKDIFAADPSKHPCRNTCVECGDKLYVDAFRIGSHVICQACLLNITKKHFELSIDTDKCSFCKTPRSVNNMLYGEGVRWICEICANKAIKVISNLIPGSINCTFCGTQRMKGMVFIEANGVYLCRNCVEYSYETLKQLDESD